MKIDDKILEKLVREVVAKHLTGDADTIQKTVDEKSGVLAVKTASVKPEPFDTGKAGDEVYLTDVLNLKESPRLGCGVMEMKKTVFDWTLNYDEVDYVIDGTLEIIIDGRKIVGNKGDIILIPKNTAIQFSVPD